MSDLGGAAQAKRAWIEHVLHYTFPSATVAGGSQTAPPSDDAAQKTEFIARVKDLTIQASLLAEPFRTEVLAQARHAAEAIKEMDIGDAGAEVEYLESAYATAAGTARVEEARKASKGSIKYRKLQLDWRAAQTGATTELDRFISALLADPDVQEDERYEELVDASSTATSLVPQFGGDLSDLLDQLDATTDEAARKPLHEEARKLIDEYSAMLDEAEGLRELQSLSDDEFGGISFFGGLQTALHALQAAIP